MVVVDDPRESLSIVRGRPRLALKQPPVGRYTYAVSHVSFYSTTRRDGLVSVSRTSTLCCPETPIGAQPRFEIFSSNQNCRVLVGNAETHTHTPTATQKTISCSGHAHIYRYTYANVLCRFALSYIFSH